MGEVFFTLKSFAVALVLLACMQYKVGGETLETKAVRWVSTSSIGAHLKDVADGAIKVTTKAYDQALAAVGAKSGKSVGFSEWKVEFKHKTEEKAQK